MFSCLSTLSNWHDVKITRDRYNTISCIRIKWSDFSLPKPVIQSDRRVYKMRDKGSVADSDQSEVAASLLPELSFFSDLQDEAKTRENKRVTVGTQIASIPTTPELHKASCDGVTNQNGVQCYVPIVDFTISDNYHAASDARRGTRSVCEQRYWFT